MIRIDRLSRCYRRGEDKVDALRDVSLQIDEGEFVAITGASGSGKSTLLNILGCLDRPSSGAYRLRDQDVANMPDGELSAIRNREIGFVFQSFNLIPHLNVIENVEIPLFYQGMAFEQRRQLCSHLIARVGLSERINHSSSELSGGECQRVAIARAVANSPAIILADEPTGNLDRASSDEIMQIFSELNASGKTLVVVTHDMQIAAHAGRTIHLDQGALCN